MLRTLTESDLPGVLCIETVAQTHPWRMEQLRSQWQQNQHHLGVVMNEKLVGYGLIQDAKVEWELVNLAIHPDHQRQGLGWLCLQGLIRAAQVDDQCEQLHLEVRHTNESAIALYQKAGFVVVGSRKTYYPATGQHPAADAQLMTLEVTP